MKVCYRESDGAYCDSADSHAKYPGDEAFILGTNVIGRFGGKPEDYVIIEVDLDETPQPCLKKLQAGVLVDDDVKIAANLAAEDEAAQEVQDRTDLVAKFKDKTATQDDICEFLSGFGG